MDITLTSATLGFAILHASTSSPAANAREPASLAAFLFGVIGLLLFIFFTVVLLTTVSRALRRKRENTPSEPTDTSVDAWAEAGKRFGKAKPGRGSKR